MRDIAEETKSGHHMRKGRGLCDITRCKDDSRRGKKLVRHKYKLPGVSQCGHNVSVIIVIVDLHRTAAVARALDVARAVGTPGCEGSRARWFAGRWRADGRAL